MKGTIVLISIACCSSLFSCSSSKKTTTAAGKYSGPVIMWQDKPIVADGHNDEWSLPYSFMDSKAKIEYSLSNDRNNLYVTVKSSDRMTELKMLHAGMKVWIDANGRKEKATGIFFPLANTEPMEMPKRAEGMDEERPGHGGNQRMKALITQARDYSLQGFIGCTGAFMVAQHNDCGIETKINEDDGVLTWEAIVPFKSFYKASVGPEDQGKAMSICVEIDALKQQPAKEGEGYGGGMGGGRGGMGAGGGHGMGGGRGGMGGGREGMGEDRTSLFETTFTWEKIHLAYKG